MFTIGLRHFFLEEGSLMGGFGGYIKFLTVVSTIFGGIFYYVPISRSYFRKGCHILIDLVALTLKSALNSFESDPETVNQTRVTFPNVLNHREHRISKEERRRRRQEIRIKNRGNDGNRNEDFSTVQLYPGRGLELQKYMRGSHGGIQEAEIYTLKDPRNATPADVKWSKSTIRRRDDVALYSENDDARTVNSKADDINHLKKRKSRTRRDDTEIQKLEDKLRKLRRRIRSIATVPDKDFKQQKEMEALAIIEELLINSDYKIEIKRLKNIANRPEDDKRVIDVISEEIITSGMKSRGSSRQGSPRVLGLPKTAVEDTSEDVAVQPPLVNDRVTSMMKNALHWVFGRCPKVSLTTKFHSTKIDKED
uniref:ANKRD20A3 protein n=1 Tax=Fopius arisanus TaxID=64838 RepID=A0A0C9Q378_9HYME